jgi:thiamine transport system ATP-binding protein
MIQFDAIHYQADDFEAEFDFSLPDQGFVMITGPSGGGKSTLLSLIAGFVMPQQGRILINGQDARALSPAQRPVSLLFQEHNLFAHLSAFENAALGLSPDLKLDDAARSKVLAALARVGLDGKGQSLPAQLSGGERQRVALARALLRDKPILLLDEPFAGLGPKLRREMLSLVHELQKEKALMVILVTHEPDDIRQAGDLAGFVGDGRLKTLAKVDEFFDQPELAAYL